MPLIFLTGVILLINRTVWSQAFPINSDVAVQPAESQFIYRTQVRYRSFNIDASAVDIKNWIQTNVLVYGWTSRFSTVLGVPVLYRESESPITEDEDVGFMDVNLLFRYQLWKKLDYLKSQSWTILGGIQIPTYDTPFSSRSWDFILGTVYSWRENRNGFDLDLVYQLNTENDKDFDTGDVLRYDLVYQYRLWPAEYQSETKRSLTGLLELNGEYQEESELEGHKIKESDGHQLFISPGIVLASKRVKYETGLQLPIHLNVGNQAAEDNIRFVFGFTMSF